MDKVNPSTKKVYRDRFNPTQTNQDWTQVLFKEGVYLQGAELNEIQAILVNRIGSVVNRLIPDGALLAGGELTQAIDETTGVLVVNLREAVVKYFSTLFRVPSRTLFLQGSADSVGRYTIGVLLTRQYLTAIQDPRLYQEVEVVQGFGTEGADREYWDVQWTFQIDGPILPGYTQPLEIQDLGVNPDKYFFPVYRLPLNDSGNNYQFDFRAYLSQVVDEIHDSFIVSGLELSNQDNAGRLTTTNGPNKFQYQDIDYLEFILTQGVAYVAGKRIKLDSKQVFKLPRALDERFIDRDRIDLLEKEAFPNKTAFVCLGLTLDSEIPTLDSLVPTLDVDCDVHRRAINFSFTLGPVDFVLDDNNQPQYPDAFITITLSTEAYDLPIDNNLAKVVLRDLLVEALNLLPNRSLPNVSYAAKDSNGNNLLLNADFTENDVKEAILRNFLILGINLTGEDPLGRVIPAIKFYSRKFGDLGRSQTLKFTTDNNENITFTLSASDPPTDNFEGGLLRPLVPLNYRPVSQVKEVEIGSRVRKVLVRDPLTAIDDPGVEERITNLAGVILVFDNHTNYRPGLDFNVTTDGRISWASALNAPTPGEKYTIIYSTTKKLKAGKARHLKAIETITRVANKSEYLVSPSRRNILNIIRIISGNKLYQLGRDYYLNPDRTGVVFLPNRGPSVGSTFDIEFDYAVSYDVQDYLAIDKYDFNTRVLVKRVFDQYDEQLTAADDFFIRSLDVRNSIELLDTRLYQLEQPVYVSYYYYLNREDLLYLDNAGNVRVLQGKSEYQNFITPPVPHKVLPIATIQLPADSSAKDVIIRHFGNRCVTQPELRQLVTRVKEIEAILLELVLKQKVTEEIPFSASLVDAYVDNFTNIANLDLQDELIQDNADSVLIPIASQSSLELPSQLVLHDKSPNLVIDLERSFIDATSWSKVYTLPFNTYIAKQQLAATASVGVQNVTLTNNLSSCELKPSVDEWLDRVTDEKLVEQISNGWLHTSELFTRQVQLINLIRWYDGEETDEQYFPWTEESLDFPHASNQDYVDYLGITKKEIDNTRRSSYNLIDVISKDYSLMRPRRVEFHLKGFLPFESIKLRFGGYELPCFPLGTTQQGLAPDKGFHLDAVLLSVKPQGNNFNYNNLRKRIARAYSNYEFNWQGVEETTCLLENQKPNSKILTHYVQRTIEQVFGLPADNPLVQEITDGLLDDFTLIENLSGTVKADENGEAVGFFHIPALLIPTGDKVVEFIGNQRSYTRDEFLAFNHKNRLNKHYRARSKASIFQEVVDKFTPVDVNSKYKPLTWDYIDGLCKPVQSHLGQYETEQACILDNPPAPPYVPQASYPIQTSDSYQLPILQVGPNSHEFVFITGYHEVYLNTNATDRRQYRVKTLLSSPELVADLDNLQVQLVEVSDLTDVNNIKLVLFGSINTQFDSLASFSTLKPRSSSPQYDLRIVLEDIHDGQEYIFNFFFVPGFASIAKPKEQQMATAKAVAFLPENLYEYYSNTSIPNPIAYTFTVERRTPVRAVKIAITKVPQDPNKRIRVEIRNTLVGYPGDTILGAAELSVREIECLEPLTGNVDQPEFTEFVFTKEPVYLDPLEVYALVVVATDKDFEVAVADLGSRDVFGSTNLANTNLAFLVDKNDPDKFFVANQGTTWSVFFNRRLCFTLVACDFYGLEVGTIERFSGDDCLNLSKITPSTNPEGFEGCLTLRGRPNTPNSQVFVPARYHTFNKTSLTCQYTDDIYNCKSYWINIHYNRLNIFNRVNNTFAIRHLFYGRDGISPVLLKESLPVVTGIYNHPANFITKEVVLNEDLPFNNIRLAVDEYLPPECYVTYSLSVDGGRTWIAADNELGPNGEITTSQLDDRVQPIANSLEYNFRPRVCTWELASDFIYDPSLRKRVGSIFTQLSGYARRYKIRISMTTTNNAISPVLKNLRIVAYDDVTSNRMLAQNEGRVKVDADDISSGFLRDKLIAGRGIEIVPIGSPLGTSPSYIEIRLTDLGLTEDVLFTGNVTIGTREVRSTLTLFGNFTNVLQDDGIGPVEDWIIDLSKSMIHKRVVTRSGSLAAPINAICSGQLMILIIMQNCPTGAITISWPDNFKWAGGVVPTLSQEPGAVDILEGIFESTSTECDPDGIWYVRLTKNFF